MVGQRATQSIPLMMATLIGAAGLLASLAAATARSQRQTGVNQLYTGGLTGGGTSFNSWNNGYYNSYQPQQQYPAIQQQQQQVQYNEMTDDFLPGSRVPFTNHDVQAKIPSWRGFGAKGKFQGKISQGTKSIY